MQALFLFAIFGLFTSAVLGIVGGTTVSTMQTIDKQVADTQKYFRDIAFLVTEDTVMNKVVVPSYSDATDYLKMDSIVKGTNWAWGKNTQDAWGSDIIVKVAHEYYALDASAGGIVVQPKATAILLVSAGKDKKIDPALQSKLNSASPTNINALMNIEATAGTDDIVYSFNTRRALEKRWDMVKNSLQKLGETAYKRYKRKFSDKNFNDAMVDYYKEVFKLDKSGADLIFKSNGKMKLSDCADILNCEVLKTNNILNNWQKPVAGVASNIKNTLSNVAPNMNKLDNETTTSWNKELALLKSNSTTGFNVSFRTESSMGAGAISNDILYLELDTNNNNAWRNASNNFHYEIKIGE